MITSFKEFDAQDYKDKIVILNKFLQVQTENLPRLNLAGFQK